MPGRGKTIQTIISRHEGSMQVSSMMAVELMMRRRSYRRRRGSHDIIGYLFLRFKKFKDPKSDLPVPTL